MARRGWSTSNYLRLNSGLITAVPMTIACWAKTSVVNQIQTLVALQNSGASPSLEHFRLLLASNGAVQCQTTDSSNGQQATTTTGISANTWFHACGAWDTNGTFKVAYLNGGSIGTDSNATSSPPVSGIDRLCVGALAGTSVTAPLAPSGTGDIADVCLWNVRLSDQDVACLALGIHPFLVHPEAIVGYFPMIGAFSPEINLVSTTNVLSVVGTLSQSEHCPIFNFPRKRRY